MTKLRVAFRNFSNVSNKNVLQDTRCQNINIKSNIKLIPAVINNDT